MKKTFQFLAIMISLIFFVSCEKDEDVVQLGGIGDIVITTMTPNPDGMSGAAYMQLIDGIKDTSMTNTYAYSASFSSAPCAIGKDVYVLPGFGGEKDLLKKYTLENDRLVKKWEHLLPTESGATNVVTNGNIAYIACSGTAEILVIDHTNHTEITSIDIADYGVGEKNPNAGSMVIRDNYLYVGLNQMLGGFMPAPNRTYTDVLIVDITTNEVLKMITDSTSGISTSTRPIDPNTIFIDENNDLYVVSIGAWGMSPGHNGGILRIKSGETDFDPDYKFVFNTTKVEGVDNMFSEFMQSVNYYGNGKLYATANFNALYSNPANYIKDRTVMPVEIDLAQQTIKKLDFPKSNNYGVAVGIYNDLVVFGLATTTDNGFYTYNPSTGESSKSAIVKTEGYPYTFNELD